MPARTRPTPAVDALVLVSTALLIEGFMGSGHLAFFGRAAEILCYLHSTVTVRSARSKRSGVTGFTG